jgi:hypothetical protein
MMDNGYQEHLMVLEKFFIKMVVIFKDILRMVLPIVKMDYLSIQMVLFIEEI